MEESGKFSNLFNLERAISKQPCNHFNKIESIDEQSFLRAIALKLRKAICVNLSI